MCFYASLPQNKWSPNHGPRCMGNAFPIVSCVDCSIILLLLMSLAQQDSLGSCISHHMPQLTVHSDFQVEVTAQSISLIRMSDISSSSTTG